nr:SspB-related isopeptide-forming adhesin [Ligilactobacillus salivarius]
MIKQELILGSEKDAELSYRLLSKDVDASYDKWSGGTVGRDNYKHTVMVTAHNRGSLIGDIIEVTYTNLNKSSYNGKKISKIIATFSNVTQDNLSPYNISFAIYSNPYYGFWYWQSSKITVNYKFYDENNHLISFDNADNSWITIGSLNSGKGRYESAKLNSSGKVYGFKDSSVTIHNGNTLYSDKANDSGSRIGDNWQNTYPSDVTSNYPWGTNDWDKGLDDPHAYYGAGIFKVNGNDLNVTYGTRRAVFVNPGTWATISTSIPKGSGPVTPTIHYKHTNVALEKPTPTEVTYHYDTIMPATIPGGTPISYHYNEISVPIPNPTKVDKNEKGVNIDGKNVLPGSVNNYELTMDLSKFKGIKVTDQDLAKGFYFVDDYPEKALDVDPQTFTSKTVDGKTVKGLSAKVYQSLSEVPSDVAAVLKANNITPKGAFVLISADDPAQFFKDYVETGTNITVNAPMKVKAGFAGKYENKAWQLTFGQGEATDIVSNNVPKIDPKKDIVISADNRTSLNNHTIELGQNFDYLLKGGILDKDQGHDIYEYKWIDDYDQNHDQYNGQFIAPLTVDVALKDGTVLKAGTDISNHVSQNIDTKTGSVEFSVDKDFLDKVDFDKGGFAADILMSVKKIKAGEVDNTYTNIINGQKFGSNTVHSTTPEPKTPETPATPQTPTTTPSASVTTPQTPATPQPVKMVTSTPSKAPESPALPQMGETNDTLAEEVVGFAAIVAVLGMAGTSLKKRKD